MSTNETALTKISPAPDLSPALRTMANDLPVTLRDPQDFTSELAVVIGQAYRKCARNITAEDLTAEAQMLYVTVRDNFTGLSLEEVRRAIFDGIQADAHLEYIELSERKYYAWLSAYQKGVIHEAVKKSRETMNAPAQVSQEEQRMHGINLCCNVFEDYRKGSVPKGFFGVVYKILKQEGLLKPTKEKAWAIYEQARLETLEFLNKKLAPPCPLPRHEKADIEERIKKLTNEPKTPEKTAQSRAEELALLDYFDGLIEMGQELKDMFD